MNQEIRNCQNCKKDFTIEPDDFAFYDKIKVPAPTFCPDCRAAQRMVWRNERTFYKRICDAPGHNEELITIYAPETNVKVYDQTYWWSDNWDPLVFGRRYEFSTPFFKQFKALLENVPLINVFNVNSRNSDYCNHSAENKNCYLLTGGGWNENVMYSNRTQYNKDSLDVYTVDHCELCYECMFCSKSYKLAFSQYCENCNNSFFLYNCRNCSDCFSCANLRNKTYCFFNEQLTKEEYNNKIKDLNLGQFKEFKSAREKFYKEIYLSAIHKYADIINCNNVSGDHIKNARNCKMCFDIGGDDTENCKYVNVSGFKAKDLFDTGPGAGWGSELLYGAVDVNEGNRLVGCIVVYSSNEVNYSINCHSCSYCFGCIGLRNKNYCILNRQYSKEEYEILLPKIIEHMKTMPYIDVKGHTFVFGDFFPSEICPFAYNETVAQEYFPVSKDQAIEFGATWKEVSERNYTISADSENLPNDIKDVKDSITKEIIGCAHKGLCEHPCTTAFKITEQELQFYRKFNITLPRICPNCRHYERLVKRTPLKLWHRQCMCEKDHPQHEGRCPNEFETSYAPERPEIVYCEKCYQQEVI